MREDLYDRHLTQLVRQRLTDEPVVVVDGPRTVGKSTLVRALATERSTSVLDLDDLATREAVAADPAFYVGGDPPVIIDEYQHVPELLDAIKAELNRDLRPGRFLLTGSTRYGSSPRAAQSLAGRAHVLTLWPLSQGELLARRESFLDHLLDAPESLLRPGSPHTNRDEVSRRILAGGFPLAVDRSPEDRARWFRDFVRLVVDKDVLELSRVRQRDRLPRFLARLAAQTGQVLNVSSASQDVGVDPSTGGDYLQLLEAVFLVQRLPAWGRTLGSRVGSLPKVHVGDAGMAAHLLGITDERLAGRDPAAMTEFGHVVETFVVGELRKQAGWSVTHVEFGHYRTHDGHEVDLVLERDDGRVVAVEVKASGTVRSADLTGLRHLRGRLGERFEHGVVLHLGEHASRRDDRLTALPIDRLWHATPPAGVAASN